MLQHVEATFDPLPYDLSAAAYSADLSSVRAAGRAPRERASDLMIAATAAGNQLPLYTANPGDFRGSENLVDVIEVKARPDNL